MFTEKPTATIWAKDSNGEYRSIDGVTTAATTSANAASQINKIFDIAGLSVVADGMSRIKTEEGD